MFSKSEYVNQRIKVFNIQSIEYLKWLSQETETNWWCDSADTDELQEGFFNGATGVTTNPCLIAASLSSNPEYRDRLLATIPDRLSGDVRAEAIMEKITAPIASMFHGIYTESKGAQGYVCAQVNPLLASCTDQMIDMAKRMVGWYPNIAVKLPVTASGLDALEECAASGITITATVSFTLPQVVQVALRYEKGVERARRSGIKPGKCFAVVMIGRIDDYLREVAIDSKIKVDESDIRQAGIAILKQAYSIFKNERYQATLLPAGMRGVYHTTELSGADMVLSIHPKIQKLILEASPKMEERINIPVEDEVIQRLKRIPEFVRAYHLNGMKPEEFITYGAVQKTLSQFIESGWNTIKSY